MSPKKSIRRKTLAKKNIHRTTCGDAYKFLYDESGPDEKQDRITCERQGESNKYNYFIDNGAAGRVHIKPRNSPSSIVNVRSCLGYKLQELIAADRGCKSGPDLPRSPAPEFPTRSSKKEDFLRFAAEHDFDADDLFDGLKFSKNADKDKAIVRLRAAVGGAPGELNPRDLVVEYLTNLEINGNVKTPEHIYNFFELLFLWTDINNDSLIEILHGANVIVENDLGAIYNDLSDDMNVYMTCDFMKGSSHISDTQVKDPVIQCRLGEGSIPCITRGGVIKGENPNFELLIGKKLGNTWFQLEAARGNRETKSMTTVPHIKSTTQYVARRTSNFLINAVSLGQIDGPFKTNIGACGNSEHDDGNRLVLKTKHRIVQNKTTGLYNFLK